MSDIYEVILYDDYGTQKAVLQGWEYLEFTQRVNSAWNHNLRFELSPEDSGGGILSVLRDNLDVDWHIRVKRTDPITNVESLVYEGFNRTIVDQLNASGGVILNLYGVGYTELLSRRVVVPATGYVSSDKNASAETAIKEYVNEQAVSPVDINRIIPGLSIETDTGFGPIVEHSAAYINLLTTVNDVSVKGEIDYGIVGGPTVGTYILKTRDLWGFDKTTENVDGNSPVIFSVGHGNMSIPIFSRNRSDERNTVYVAGQGEGINRNIISRSSIYVGDSRLNRREAYLDARQQKTTAGLKIAGDNYLNAHSPQLKLSFNVLQTDSCRWITNWGLGDLITAKYFNRGFVQKIVSVTVRVGSTESEGASTEYISAEPWLLGVVGRSELNISTILG
jgi:hypothetical protein